MAIFGKIDQILAPKGISMTIAPFGAVCAVLFATPASPGARVQLTFTVFPQSGVLFSTLGYFNCTVLFIPLRSDDFDLFLLIFVQKYNMFMAQIGCAAIGVLALALLGPGWVARSASLAASVAFMIYTRSTHPPGKNHSSSLSVIF